MAPGQDSPLTDFLLTDHALALHCLTHPSYTYRAIIALMPVMFLSSLSERINNPA